MNTHGPRAASHDERRSAGQRVEMPQSERGTRPRKRAHTERRTDLTLRAAMRSSCATIYKGEEP